VRDKENFVAELIQYFLSGGDVSLETNLKFGADTVFDAEPGMFTIIGMWYNSLV